MERLLTLPQSDPAREGFLARLEKAVHEIGQIRGSGEDPEVVKWQGMLDLAKGQTGKAVRSLYAAYEQIKAANPPEQRDPFLSWTLAKIFARTAETGAVIEFLGTALGLRDRLGEARGPVGLRRRAAAGRLVRRGAQCRQLSSRSGSAATTAAGGCVSRP